MVNERDLNLAETDPVQLRFAKLALVVILTGLGLIVVAFAVYAAGILPSVVPLADVPDSWTLSPGELSELTGRGGGWSWIGAIGQGENLSFAALVFFPASIIFIVAITGISFLRERKFWYGTMAILLSAILALSASGLLRISG